MHLVKWAVGAFLILHGAAAALFSMAEPLYHDTKSLGYSPVWAYLDPMTLAGILLGAVFAGLQMRAAAANSGGGWTGQRVTASLLFYGFLFVGIAFYREYFAELTGRIAFDVSADVIYTILYAIYPLLAVTSGVRLLRGGRD